VGWVFLSEGIQKFLFPVALGTGRFAKIGIPWPQYSAPFVGVVEVVCGTLLILGLFTSLASVLLLIDVVLAIATTKFPMLLKQGFWATLNEARTDFSMLFGLVTGSPKFATHPDMNLSGPSRKPSASNGSREVILN